VKHQQQAADEERQDEERQEKRVAANANASMESERVQLDAAGTAHMTQAATATAKDGATRDDDKDDKGEAVKVKIHRGRTIKLRIEILL
jgi:hypothetical protein